MGILNKYRERLAALPLPWRKGTRVAGAPWSPRLSLPAPQQEGARVMKDGRFHPVDKLLNAMQVKGIRRRWMINSISLLAALLVLLVVASSLFVRSYYENGMQAELELKVRTAAGYFSAYASDEDYFDAAERYTSTFEDAASMELQFLTAEGSVICSSSALTIAGSTAETPETAQVRETGRLAVWKGKSPQTGEKIMVVSAPFTDGEELAGILRCISSMEPMDRQVFFVTLCAVALAALVLVVVYVSNIYFVRSIVDPVEDITDTAKRIAAGSYGIQVEKKYDDEIGDLTDAINDMSLRIKQAERMKSEFISSVSHELRTPLTAITGWAETIMTGEARDEQDIRKGMGIIASEARRLSGMVEELLDFSRIEDGRFTLSVEPMDIKAEIEDAVYTYHEFLGKEGITVHHTDCEEEFPPIPGDSDRLRQVFCNLLDNAAKHGGSGKRIETAIFPEGGEIVITIRDYGPGIPPEELPNVKYKFYKGSSTARGSGIGLAVCEEIVTRHKGTLTIRNADDGEGGCVAEVRLPT